MTLKALQDELTEITENKKKLEREVTQLKLKEENIKRKIENTIEVLNGENCIQIKITKDRNPTPEVISAVHDAIQDGIKGFPSLKKIYFGVKSYEGFISQRHDSPYGMGPTHGNIWFKIEMKPHFRKVDLSNESIAAGIKFLRDFLKKNNK